MHFKISILFVLAFAIGCKKDSTTENNDPQSQTTTSQSTINGKFMRYSGSDYSQELNTDTANRMIQSYLTSINYPNSDSKLRSLTFDADTLRTYLSNTNIKTLKFVLAHKRQYMNSGGYGADASNSASAMTLIIVGLSETNEYIYNCHEKVYDFMRPCPTNCDDVSPLLVK